jgi:hypothetical protein
MQKCQIVRDRTAAEDIYAQGISSLRYALPFSVLITALLTSFEGLDADELSFELSLKRPWVHPMAVRIAMAKTRTNRPLKVCPA